MRCKTGEKCTNQLVCLTSVEGGVAPAVAAQLVIAGVADPQRLGGLGGEQEPLAGAGVAADHAALPTVMSPVYQCELHLPAAHAGVGLAVRHPDRRVLLARLLPGLPQQVLDTLTGERCYHSGKRDGWERHTEY